MNSIAFSVNKKAIILGFGIFTADKNEKSKALSVVAKFIPENNSYGTYSYS